MHRTIAITPSNIKNIGWEETCKISRDYALKGIETISQLPRGDAKKPLRFIYLSGVNAERDQSKRPWLLADYGLMRVIISLAKLLKVLMLNFGFIG